CMGGRWQELISGKQLFPGIVDCANGLHGQHETAVQATGLGHPLPGAFARWPFPGIWRRSIELQRVDDRILPSLMKAILLKDADADIPIYRRANAEYARLRQHPGYIQPPAPRVWCDAKTPFSPATN